jgi:hypothetical protein
MPSIATIISDLILRKITTHAPGYVLVNLLPVGRKLKP